MPFLEGNVERMGTPKRKLGKLTRKKPSERLTANSVPEKISIAYHDVCVQVQEKIPIAYHDVCVWVCKCKRRSP